MLSFLQRPKIEAIRHRETKKQTHNEASDFVNSGQQFSLVTRTKRFQSIMLQGIARGILRLRSPFIARTILRNGVYCARPTSQIDRNSLRHFASEKKIVRKATHQFVPRKAPVSLTETARKFFKSITETKQEGEVAGIILNYHQSSSGEPRMVFSFDFVKTSELGPDDEGVSLEILDDGSPKPPSLSWADGKPKLYIHHNAFMKVLGSKIDVDLDTLKLTLYDREGNIMDPNA